MRSPGATGERTVANASQAERKAEPRDVAGSDPATVARSPSSAMASQTSGNARGNLLDGAQPVSGSTKERTSWPTRRKRSQLVELPVQELDHVRGDLARIGLLTLGMVIVLVTLTFVLR
jgi:hypothetical protein